jgi:hypothetical protein
MTAHSNFRQAGGATGTEKRRIIVTVKTTLAEQFCGVLGLA